MKFRIIVGLLIVLIVYSCSQQKSKDEQQTENGPNTHLKSKTGLKIEYKQVRGITETDSFTDSLGTKLQLRYIPSTITNDSTISIHVKIAFSKEYDYPIGYGDQQFNVIRLPKEWSRDGVGPTDSMINELPKYVDQSLLDETIDPGEKIVLAIGTLFPSSVKHVPFPMAVFSQNNRVFHHWCDSLIIPNKSTDPHLTLELNLGFASGDQDSPEICTIIPCGQIFYIEH